MTPKEMEDYCYYKCQWLYKCRIKSDNCKILKLLNSKSDNTQSIDLIDVVKEKY